jgi:hypothetical protein
VAFGDSLLWEARDATSFFGALQGFHVTVDSMGGTAPCDWLDRKGAGPSPMELEAAKHPAVVALVFSGNLLTNCILRRLGRNPFGPSGMRRATIAYRWDLTRAIMMFRRAGSQVLLVAPPAGLHPNDADFDIPALYRKLAAQYWRVRFVDGGADITPDGRYHRELPCSKLDPRTACRRGEVVVRSADGHFCPNAPSANFGVPSDCRVYSSGAVRFGATIAGSLAHLPPEFPPDERNAASSPSTAPTTTTTVAGVSDSTTTTATPSSTSPDQSTTTDASTTSSDVTATS